MQPEIDSSEQERVKLLIKKAELEAECAKLKAKNVEYVKLKVDISKFEAENVKLKAENTKFLNFIKKDYADFEAHIVKLKHLNLEQPDRLESIEAMIIEIKAQNAKNKSIIEEYEKELECKKNRKF